MAVDYDPVKGPSGGPAPGAVALATWALARWPTLRLGGIYDPRQVRGGTGWSLHAEGRADDLMVPVVGGAVGDQVADFLAAHAAQLGIQELIWNKRIWTSRAPYWRPYVHGPGGSDHTDHVHVGLAWRTARDTPLTDALLNAIAGSPGASSTAAAPVATNVGFFSNPLGIPGVDTVRAAAVKYLAGMLGLGLVAVGAWRLTRTPQEA
jgi:hypothetical protein